jgi:hypothetical protein
MCLKIKGRIGIGLRMYFSEKSGKQISSKVNTLHICKAMRDVRRSENRRVGYVTRRVLRVFNK